MPDPIRHVLGVHGLGFALLLAMLPGCGQDTASSPQSLEDWVAHRQQLEETVWADEIESQQYEATLVALWDSLLRADRNGAPGRKAEILARWKGSSGPSKTGT